MFLAKPFTDYTAEDHALVTGVNLAGFFWLTQRVISQMLKQRSGHVVYISASIANRADSVEPTALTALTKGGLAAVTGSLAIEYASRGIRVNAVAPGIIRTPLHPPEAYTTEALAGKLPPLGHAGQVSDVVDVILHLESALASSCTSTAAGLSATERRSGVRRQPAALLAPALAEPRSRPQAHLRRSQSRPHPQTQRGRDLRQARTSRAREVRERPGHPDDPVRAAGAHLAQVHRSLQRREGSDSRPEPPSQLAAGYLRVQPPPGTGQPAGCPLPRLGHPHSHHRTGLGELPVAQQLGATHRQQLHLYIHPVEQRPR